ncbi:MAG TPA: hypothetical protein PLK73_00540 [Candidatus Omnitrophota bacterium]|jgi:hypothetical protein|nr:hypothetical protein [Candidatus Omnitrophota bacterium]
MRAKLVLGCTLMMLIFLYPCVHASDIGYFERLGQTFTRGFKNVISSPYEIPYTINRYDKTDDGNPRGFRNIAGFFDGSFRMLTRLGCGAWDMAWALIPGDQEGLKVNPETFF